MKNMKRMSRIRSVMLLGLMMMSTVFTSFAQLCQLSMTVSQTPVQQLSITDVDFQHFQTHSLLFTASITNNQAVVVTTQLRVRLNILLADGTNLTDAVNFVTQPFSVPPAGKSFTNLDLGQDIKAATPVQLSQEAQDKVEDVALATGKFPAGQYILALTLEPLGCNGDTKDVKFDLRNPSRVDLRSPRDGDVTNEFPFFEFYQDGSLATLTVAEKLPDQSREDALSHKPSMLEVDLTNGQSSFMYSGGRPLEPGKTYVWQVASKSQVIGGTTVDVESPIWSFTVSNAGVEASPDAILLQLEQMLGPSYKSLFDQIRKGGYKLDNATLNNSTLSQQDLLDLINTLRDISGSIQVSFE